METPMAFRKLLLSLLLKTTALAAVAAFVQGCAQTPPSGQASQAPSDATMATHVAAATRDAGTDLGPLLGLCKPAPAAQPPQAELDRGLRALIDKPAPPPGKAFDNLYFVGADWVSAWAIKTSDGIILIDALNNQVEAAALIEGGMRKLGLDPAQIKYVVVTHGHGDHYGGAPYLAQKYRARVVMSEADWTMTETKLEFATPVWGAPPKRGARRHVGEGRRPPHAGRHHRHAVHHAGPHHGHHLPGVRRDRQRPEAPCAAVGRHGLQLRQERAAAGELHRRDAAHGHGGEAQKIDVLVSNHSGYDGSQGKLAALRQQPAGRRTRS
jgi:metallo-beta-lactamase class B